MAPQTKEAVAGRIEWRIAVVNGSSETLVPDSGPADGSWLNLQSMIVGLISKLWRFLGKAWDLGVDDPRKVIHCLKVGVALTVVSLFYYMRPLYESFGKNAMWAVMTIVVVFEQTVGATLYKCLNRASGTFLAGFLAIGVHWVASKTEENFEPVIVGASVFLLASAATFARFIPMVKARFDYGAMIFILTFSLVSVSGYRVDKLFSMACDRISTIIIGTSMCIFISMLVCPIWAGEELYLLITRNMDKLAISLDASVAEYFNDHGSTLNNKEESHKELQGYKCVLNSKATEESMANSARWEPAHGRFNFRHPWKQYLKIGTSMRTCAYCIEALNSCISSENQVPESIKKHLSDICLKVSSSSSGVIRELARTIRTMRKSSTIDVSVGEMKTAVQELQHDLKSLANLLIPPLLPENRTPKQEGGEPTPMTKAVIPLTVPVMEVIPVVTVASLLIEITARIAGIVSAVDELASLAEFKPAAHDKPKQKQQIKDFVSDQWNDKETIKALPRV